MDQLEHARNLLSKYLENKCSEEERNQVERFYLEQFVHQPLPEKISEDMLKTEIWANVSLQIEKTVVLKRDIRPLWLKVAAAAAVIFAISTALYFYLKPVVKMQPQLVKAHDIGPGSNKAILTLANGNRVAITTGKNGLLANQGNTSINVNGNHIIYHTNGSVNDTRYNTLTTPRGGQYPLILSDGTHVWLDAASSITYPVAFTGRSREVRITGQVYFEVAHNPLKPFRVTANGETVEVLGTHFNINAYTDEPDMKTTLLEGKIKISSLNGVQAILKPGQQARLSQSKKLTIINNADTDEAIAWHNGLFEFHNADIPTVMRQLSRWYDVDISYEGKMPDRKFSGEIYRNVTAMKAADILSYENIHFRIEGKNIIVMP